MNNLRKISICLEQAKQNLTAEPDAKLHRFSNSKNLAHLDFLVFNYSENFRTIHLTLLNQYSHVPVGARVAQAQIYAGFGISN